MLYALCTFRFSFDGMGRVVVLKLDQIENTQYLGECFHPPRMDMSESVAIIDHVGPNAFWGCTSSLP